MYNQKGYPNSMIKISEAEWKIMNILWDTQPKTMMQLTKELSADTGWTKYTVMTFLKRLEAKGAIQHVEGEKAKLYYTKISRFDAILEEKRSFIDRVFNGNASLLVTTMIEQGDFTNDDLEYLKDFLEKQFKDHK